MRYVSLLFLALLLAACGGSSSPPPPVIIAVPPPAPPPPPPPITAWAITHGSAPSTLALDADGRPYFDFPLCASASACWVSYVEQPYGALTGKSLVTLSYSITGTAPVFDNLSAGNNCGGPPALSLLLHQAGDNMSGQVAFAFYRWFSSSAVAQPLALGAHSLTVPLDDISKWTPVYPNLPGADAGFTTAKATIATVGLGLGGGCFAAHGVAVTSGSARFVITGFGAQ